MAQRENKKRADNAVEASSMPSSSAVADTSKALKPKPKITKKTSNQISAKEIVKTTPEVEASSLPSSSGMEPPKLVKPATKIVKKSRNRNFANRRRINHMPHARDKLKDGKKDGQEAGKELSNTESNDEKNTKSHGTFKKKGNNNGLNSEKRQEGHKSKEKLGGLIMMCNSKTKPDCFRFRVMGVSLNKKEFVLAIKPGLKLFLYDFDLRLLYGIYRASSVGGMKLEPKAFDGAFPVQVRFKVHKDCFPLPEDVFIKAIRDKNSDKAQRFQTELTVQQVKKLTDLFKPLQQRQSSPRPYGQVASPVRIDHSAHMPIVSRRETYGNRREPRINRERFSRDRYSPRKERMHLRPADSGREQFSRHRGSSHRESTFSRKEHFSDDPLFLSEKDYRTYGLGRAEHATRSPVRIPSLDPYQDDRHREQLHRHPSSLIRRDAPPLHREELPSDPLFFNENAYRTYGLGRELPAPSVPPVSDPRSLALDPYSRDSNYTYGYNALSSDPYALPPRREAMPSDPYALPPRREAMPSDPYIPLPMRETHVPNFDYNASQRRMIGDEERIERLYLTHPPNMLPDYNHIQHLVRTSDHAAGTLSSRYSFPGPPVSYHR